MNKEDFLNAKWDARDWTDTMKRKWQERMLELGFKWRYRGKEVREVNRDYFYTRDDNELTFGDNYDFFSQHKNKELKYFDVFSDSEPGKGQKHDSEKPRYDLLPPIAIDEMAKVMTFGAKKYEPDNWRHVDNAVERYRAALLRHSFAMLRGEKLDPETGLPHAAHAMCCAAFLVELDSD